MSYYDLNNVVDSLSPGSLKHLKQLVEFKLKKLQEEEKISLWVISDDCLNYAAYNYDDFDLAVDEYILIIKGKRDKYGADDISINLNERLIYKSEVDSYLAIESGYRPKVKKDD